MHVGALRSFSLTQCARTATGSSILNGLHAATLLNHAEGWRNARRAGLPGCGKRDEPQQSAGWNPAPSTTLPGASRPTSIPFPFFQVGGPGLFHCGVSQLGRRAVRQASTASAGSIPAPAFTHETPSGGVVLPQQGALSDRVCRTFTQRAAALPSRSGVHARVVGRLPLGASLHAAARTFHRSNR